MNLANHAPYPGENLARFRYHTGATLRPVAPDEPCPALFRDIGPVAMAKFLRGQLQRLAGPFAPILYTRTADYQEPYVDHEPVGRLVFLQPKTLQPWHSGIPTILVASIQQCVDPRTIGFIPAHIDLREADSRLGGIDNVADLRAAFAGRQYDETIRETIAALDRVNNEHAETERWAEPLRRRLQSHRLAESESARDWMSRHAVLESDLCTAWHHLPRERRDRLRDALHDLQGEGAC